MPATSARTNAPPALEDVAAAALTTLEDLTRAPTSGLDGESLVYVLRLPETQPWWRDYLGLTDPLPQKRQSALGFFRVEGRTFALSFGDAYHRLSAESYEHDFGIRVTLNCVDRVKVKNTDAVEASTARRQRTQVPVDSDLSVFDLNQDDSILKSLTGKVKDEYREMMSAATGSASLRISSRYTASELPELCRKLFALYESDAYVDTFPEMAHITTVKEPTVIRRLEEELEVAIRTGTGSLRLSIPMIVEYGEAHFIRFEDCGAPSEILESVFLPNYFDYVQARGRKRSDLTMSDLKKHHIRLVTEDGQQRQGFSVYRALLFETPADSENATYYLVEGQWYAVDNDYLRVLDEYLNRYFKPLAFPTCVKKLEAGYNQDLADALPSGVNLDRTDIRPRGQTEIEP